jgi:hypothetical protein
MGASRCVEGSRLSLSACVRARVWRGRRVCACVFACPNVLCRACRGWRECRGLSGQTGGWLASADPRPGTCLATVCARAQHVTARARTRVLRPFLSRRLPVRASDARASVARLPRERRCEDLRDRKQNSYKQKAVPMTARLRLATVLSAVLSVSLARRSPRTDFAHACSTPTRRARVRRVCAVASPARLDLARTKPDDATYQNQIKGKSKAKKSIQSAENRPSKHRDLQKKAPSRRARRSLKRRRFQKLPTCSRRGAATTTASSSCRARSSRSR